LKDPGLRSAQPILLVGIPMVRVANGNVERTDFRLFMLNTTVRRLGIALDIWYQAEGIEGPKVDTSTRDPSADGRDVVVVLLNPAFEITRDAAAHYNGYSSPTGLKYLAIGAGALGSQIIDNLTRFG